MGGCALGHSVSHTEYQWIGNSFVSRCGNCAIVDVNATVTAGTWQYTKVLDIPEGYRPSRDYWAALTDGVRSVHCRVEPSGAVSVNPFGQALEGAAVYGAVPYHLG